MNLYRCFTRRHPRDLPLGFWYAPTPAAAQTLARLWREIETGQPYTKPIETESADACWDKAYNSENKGGLPKPFPGATTTH